MNHKRLTLSLLFLLSVAGFSGYGRTGLTLISAGNQLSWNDASSWIVSSSGQPGITIPQANDTLIVRHHILASGSFTCESGMIIIETNGYIDAPAATFIIRGASTIDCAGQLSCYNLEIRQQAGFTLRPQGKATIAGLLVVEDYSGFSIQCDGNKYGSLITNGNIEGTISAEYDVEANNNQLVSSPLAGAQSGVFLNMYLRNYDEPASAWSEYIVPTTVPMSPMEGFEVLSLYNDKRVFTGIPNMGEQRIDLTSEGNRWNLIGNPYPSYLDWNLLASGNDAGIYPEGINTIYYPDNTGSGNYSVYCPGEEPVSINQGSSLIAPMQGFFIQAERNTNLSVNDYMRVHPIEQSPITVPLSAIKIRIEGNSYSDEAIVRFNTDATDGFDATFDAYKLQGVEAAPQIYFKSSADEQYSINTLGSVTSGLVVPFEVATSFPGPLNLTAIGAPEFMYRYPVYLEDESTGIYTDLRAIPVYTFDSESGTNIRRFKLHFAVPGGIDELQVNTIKVVSGESAINISDSQNQTGNVAVFTIDGKLVAEKQNFRLGLLSIPVAQANVYLVRIITPSGITTKKVYCR